MAWVSDLGGGRPLRKSKRERVNSTVSAGSLRFGLGVFWCTHAISGEFC